MHRHIPSCAAALLLSCGAAALCALAFAPRAAGQAANMNGNMTPSAGHAHEAGASNSNTNHAPTERKAEARRPAPTPPALRWAPAAPVPAYVVEWPLRLRTGAGPRSAVVEELEVGEYRVEVLAVEGDYVRVRVESEGGEGRKAKRVEGWAAWGEVAAHATALVLDARTGRVLARHALGPGIESVSFSPDGKRAIFHGPWAPAVYEADASGLAPARRLVAEGEGTFGPPAYVGSGHDLLLTFDGHTRQADGTAVSTLYAVRADAGGVTATLFAASPAGAQPARVAFSPDGCLGFAFYQHPYGDEDELPVEEDRGTVATVEVFDPATLQTVRRFKLPDAALDFHPGALVMNADGSELYLLDQSGQRLVVVETQAGVLLREVSLAGETSRLLSFAQGALGAAGPRVRYWEVTEEHHGEGRTVRVEGGRVVEDEAASYLTAEAGGTRYAVDESGHQLFTFGAGDRPLKTFDIPRHEGDYQAPVGLFVTPDGSRLLLLLALPEDGC